MQLIRKDAIEYVISNTRCNKYVRNMQVVNKYVIEYVK